MELELELPELLLISELAVLFLFWEVWDWWELLRGTDVVCGSKFH